MSRIVGWLWTSARLALLAVLPACAPAPIPESSGTVQAESAAVGSPVGGRVTAVFVADGARVLAGELLVRFEDTQERAALANAVHQAAAAAAAVADLRAGTRDTDLARAGDQARQAGATFTSASAAQRHQIAALRAAVRQASAQIADARAEERDAAADAARTRALARTGDLSLAQRDSADARETRARAQVTAARAAAASAAANLRVAQATLPGTVAGEGAAYQAAQNEYRSLAQGARPDTIRQAAAALAAANSSVAGARARLDDTIVRAPADGEISALNLHPGDLVAAGAPVATVDEDREPFVRVYVPQALLAHVAVGARVAVHPDSQPGVTLEGTVEQIDEQAQFTPENVQTADDRATLSFGVKVRIHDRGHRVHGGTTATVALS